MIETKYREYFRSIFHIILRFKELLAGDNRVYWAIIGYHVYMIFTDFWSFTYIIYTQFMHNLYIHNLRNFMNIYILRNFYRNYCLILDLYLYPYNKLSNI